LQAQNTATKLPESTVFSGRSRGDTLYFTVSRLQGFEISRDSGCQLLRKCRIYLSEAFLAHFAKLSRNGYAVLGASISPRSDVLNGTMRP
jgi:hypothetical protein